MSKRFTITEDTDINTIAAAVLANQLSAAQIGGISAEAKVVAFFALVANNNDLVGEDGWFVDSTRNLLTQLLGVEEGQVKHVISTLNKSGLFEFNGKRGTTARHRLNLDDQDVSGRLMKIMALQTDLFSPKPTSKRRKTEDAVVATDTNVVAPTNAPAQNTNNDKDVPDADPEGMSDNELKVWYASKGADPQYEATFLAAFERVMRGSLTMELTPQEQQLRAIITKCALADIGYNKKVAAAVAFDLNRFANS